MSGLLLHSSSAVVTYDKPLAEALIRDQPVHAVQTIFGIELAFALPGRSSSGQILLVKLLLV